MTNLTATGLRFSTALSTHYRVERELGQGGMATVYLAHDLRHDRDVAIKLLHPDLGAALGGERFLSEIRTTARLQHPHILPLLDSGTADGLLYYVMPYVAGETLRSRLQREHQLPFDDAIRIAREVADALGYAHSAGIVHRDIKPENILLQGGHALVADFGIALAVQHAGGQRMTQTGLSLGTPQYMSPEQAMGEKSVDLRTDIYALGAVTYEMLAGDPPFTGSSVQAIVAKVMAERPTPLHLVRDTVTPGVENAVLKALAKLPADRFSTAAEFVLALSTQAVPAVGGAMDRDGTPRSWAARLRDPLALALGALAIGLAAALTLVVRRTPVAADPFPLRMELATRAEAQVGPVTLSPDGHTVVFVGRPANGPEMLYARRLDQLSARPIPGTVNPLDPAFSPDGRSIAYIANRRRLARVSLDAGAPVMLANVPDAGGVDWSPTGDIVVGAGALEGQLGLGRVNPAAGGAVKPLTRVDSTRKELSHQFPRVLADGKTIVFAIYYGVMDSSEIGVTSLDDGKVTPLGILGTKPLGVVDGRLVYIRADGMAMAVPFDVRQRRVNGTPTAVQDSVRMWDRSGGNANAYLTHAGGLAFAHGATDRRLVWVDRNGTVQPALPDLREYRNVRLSPDGRSAAITVGMGARSDIWVLDLASGALSPLTTTGLVRTPTWSPDGHRILYVSTEGGRAEFWWQAADNSGPATRIAAPPRNPWNIDLSPDGRTAVFNAISNGTFNLESMALDSTHEAHNIAMASSATETYGRFSPDGRAIAYQSDESGRFEVYVRPFPESGSRVQISTSGGRRPIWSADGKQLFYWEDRRLTSATIARDPTVRVVSRQPLFEGRYEIDFDVAKDGKRFLMIESETTGLGLVVVPNWLTELKRATPTKP